MTSEILSKRLQVSFQENTQRTDEIPDHQRSIFSIRESIRTNIVHLYGEETLKNIKLYEKLREKKSNLLCDLSFLIKCRNNNVQPTFTRLSYHSRSRSIQSILKKASIALLKDQIRRTRKQLSATEHDLFTIHLALSNKIHNLIWHRIETITNWRAETNTQIKTEKHEKKFLNLHKNETRQTNSSISNNKQTVHNISTYQLSDEEKSILSKGFNYAIAPKSVPKEEIISSIESTITSLNAQEAEHIRQEVSKILKTSKPPSTNISRAEHQALKNLNTNKNITIVPADKGNATVVMNTEDYISKMKDLINDPSYKPVTRDPTTYLEKTTKSMINMAPIAAETKQKLIPREKSSRCPKLYGLPKIHKPDIPLRPIVSAFNSPVHKLEKYLASIMQPQVEKAQSYIRDSAHFIQILKDTKVDQDDIIASFDVKSLYPSIPIDEALEQIEHNENFPEHITNLSRHCLKNAYFLFDHQIYKQTDGAAMGSSLSPAIANLFMVYFETKALRNASLKPKVWLRYVDDIFVIWPFGKDELLNFLNYLNSIHHRIQFTLELEANNKLPFLDVLIAKSTDGSLQHTVYRKPTHTNRYLNANSHHHPSQIQGVANTLISRSLRLTDDDNRNAELTKMTTALRQNGYKNHTIKKALEHQKKPKTNQTVEEKTKTVLPYVKGTTDRIGRLLRKHNILTAYKPPQTIGSYLKNPKDKIKLENHGVYSIPCGTCGLKYIGQTNRRISARIEEHKLAIRNKQTTSALFQHHLQTGHNIDFDNTKQIANVEHYKTRIIREAIEIEKDGGLNKRDDALNLPSVWKSIIYSKEHTNTPIAHSSLTTDRPVDTRTRGAGPTKPPTNQRYDLRHLRHRQGTKPAVGLENLQLSSDASLSS